MNGESIYVECINNAKDYVKYISRPSFISPFIDSALFYQKHY